MTIPLSPISKLLPTAKDQGHIQSFFYDEFDNAFYISQSERSLDQDNNVIETDHCIEVASWQQAVALGDALAAWGRKRRP